MNITINAYSPDGFKVTLGADVATMRDALAFASAAALSGFTTAPIERREELITTVVRREHVDDKGVVTPVIDMYPTWKGDYGQFRFVGVYLNSEEDIAQFEAHSGLKVESIPLYAAQVPLQRKQARTHPNETKCKPFLALKRVTGEKEIDGVVQVVWKFAGYSTPTAVTATPTESVTPSAPLSLPPAGSMTPAMTPTARQDAGRPLRRAR